MRSAGVILVLLAIAAACAAPAHRQAGLAAERAGRLDEAELELRLAVAEHPADAEAHAALGLLYFHSRRLPGAALRELATAEHLGSRRGRRELASLYARRAAARALAGERGRFADLDEAARLGHLVDPAARRRVDAEPRAPLDAATALLGEFEAHLRGELETFPSPALAEELVLAPSLPSWAGPTRARVAGGDIAAALAAAGTEEPTLVAVEAALAGDAHAARYLEGGGDSLSYALAAATVARLLGRPEDEAQHLARAAALPGGLPALARRGDRATPRIADLDDITPRALPEPRPGCHVDVDALLALRRAARDASSRVDRLARDFVDGELPVGCRAPLVAIELLRAGDVPRARAWAEVAAEADPEEERGHLLLARVLVAEGNPRRALQSLTFAEMWSARRGTAATAVSRALRESGHAVDAIVAARLALSLADGSTRRDALVALVAAALAAGREKDAAAAFAAVAPEVAVLVAGRVRATLGVRLAPPWLPETLRPPRIAVARVDDLAADGDERTLLGIGLADDSERGARALEAYARLVQARGRADLARAARREAALLHIPY